MPKSIHLLLIDHNTLLRRCLVSALNRRRDLEVVGEAACGSEALELARAVSPDVIVIEPELPEGGPDLIRLLCAEQERTGIVVLGSGCDESVRQALLAGARGYVEKTCEPADLVRVIKQVHAGELVIGSQAIETILESLNGDAPRPSQNGHSLTVREMDVLRLVVAGRTNPEIARELFITEHTAKGHLAKILGKLSVDNRVQLAIYAIQHGLVDSCDDLNGRAR